MKRKCKYCGKTFETMDTRKEYCSSRCRKRMYWEHYKPITAKMCIAINGDCFHCPYPDCIRSR